MDREKGIVRMHKIHLVACILLIATQLIEAQIIDKPAATVKLIRFEVIPVTKLDQTIKSLEKTAGRTLTDQEQRIALESLINETLIFQAAARDHISVTEEELNTRIDLVKKTSGAGLQLNRELTDAELNAAILQTYGMTFEQYREQLRQKLLLQKYVVQVQSSYFEKIEEPTEEEIEYFYDDNKTAFVSPDIVRISHIFIDTRNLTSTSEKESARKRADEIYREYQNGIGFDDLVRKYSDDQTSRYKGGDFGYLRRDDTSRKQLLGKEFFETPFKMKEGDVSTVVKSNIGFHILKVSEYVPFQVLTLDSAIPPQSVTTVREQIKATLVQTKQVEVFNRASNDLLEELKKEAEIKIFDENIK